jgi:hypothetical protein
MDIAIGLPATIPGATREQMLEWARRADAVVDLTAKGVDAVKERARVFEEAECDELVFFPSTADPDEVDRLAAAVL